MSVKLHCQLPEHKFFLFATMPESSKSPHHCWQRNQGCKKSKNACQKHYWICYGTTKSPHGSHKSAKGKYCELNYVDGEGTSFTPCRRSTSLSILFSCTSLMMYNVLQRKVTRYDGEQWTTITSLILSHCFAPLFQYIVSTIHFTQPHLPLCFLDYNSRTWLRSVLLPVFQFPSYCRCAIVGLVYNTTLFWP